MSRGRAADLGRSRVFAAAARAGRRERGSATLLVLAVSLAVVVAGSAVLVLAEFAWARARLSAAADLAALAAAEHAFEGQSAACAAAQRIALRGGATALSCVLHGTDVQVTASAPAPAGLAALAAAAGHPAGMLRISARAGPPRLS